MASLLNNASLLLNPAGSIIAYEEDKIFSVLPSNGAGDFTFSGGDGGTRVNQQGYIEVTPANLASNSNSFTNNSDFTKTGSLSGPFSSTDGNILTPVGTSEKYSGIASLTVPANTVFTFSVYAKYLQNTALALRSVYSNGAQDASTIFNLQTNTIIGSIPGTHSNPQIISVGGGWFRYSVDINSTTPPAFPLLFRVNASNSSGNLTFTPASGDGFYISSAQINTGGLKPYQPTTDRLNYPRITYQNGRGALLSEPQRTNLNLYSQGFDNAYWNKQNASITASAGISPDGTNNAFKLNANTSAAFHIIYIGGLYNGQAAVSVFAKKGEYDFLYIRIDEPSTTTTYFNLANGTVGTVGSGHTAYIEPYNDGWYRCTTVFSKNIVNYCLGVTSNEASTVLALEANKGIYIWGSQVEASLFSTSYIPTTTATVTRPVDIASKTGASSLINASEGVLYFDGFPETRGNFNANWFVSNGSNNFIGITFGVNTIYGEVYNGSYQALLTYASTDSGRYKVALAYKVNDFAMYVNGQLAGTDTSGAVPTGLSYIDVGYQNSGTRNFSQRTNTVALFNTRLTNTQLAELTTVRSGSGGTISYSGPYTVHTFTGSATFTPSFNGQVEVLITAGGGSGAAGWGNGGGMGGGGAGGLLYASSFGVSQGTGITVTIGAGGAGTTGTTQAGKTGNLRGNPGSNSSFGGLIAIGGGGGAGDGATTATMSGGSGGGGGYSSIGTGGSGTPGQGNNGGNHSNNNGFPSNYCGGGGGGAGAVGTPGTTAGGNGGVGLPYSISGFSTYYAGGGGGGTFATTGPGGAGVGGLGGGGNGGLGNTSPGQNGTTGVNFTGGAGGAGGCPGPAASVGGNGGAGGNGIIIVRYLT
jgi:hypothetical protein